MKNLILFCIFISFLSIFACKNEKKERQATLFKEVMATHDAIMPKLADIEKLSSELRISDTLIINSNMPKKDSLHIVVESHLAALKAADESMWEWMHAFKAPEKKMPPEDAIIYLENERKHILIVKEKMTNSIENAKKSLEQIKVK